MTPSEVQKAQDMLSIIEAQRNQYMTQAVMLQAELLAARREIEELKAANAKQPELPLSSNGHITQSTAAIQ